MKKTIISSALICLAALSSGLNAQPQQQPQPQSQESFPHRYVSIGIRAAGIQVSDLTARAYPANRLILSLDPLKYVRLEGQYGVFSRTSTATIQQGGTSSEVELHDKSRYAGFGIMGMYPKDRGRFFAGLRYGINKYSDESVFSSFSSPGNSVDENTGKMTVLSGMIGGEYFLARFFSVGAEFSVASVKDVFEPSSLASNSEKSTDKTLLTEGNLVFRFYPF
jgi:hypothetical protein